MQRLTVEINRPAAKFILRSSSYRHIETPFDLGIFIYIRRTQ